MDAAAVEAYLKSLQIRICDALSVIDGNRGIYDGKLG